MAWGKMDDKFHRNRKVRDLRRRKGGMEALGVWAFWWSWCLDDLSTLGEVPRLELSRADLAAAKLLVEVGLWDETDDGYQFHDFAEYNPTPQAVAKKREDDRNRIAEKRRAERERQERESTASREDVASDSCATSRGVAVDVASTRDPNPSQPIPTHPVPVPALVRDGDSSSFDLDGVARVFDEERRAVGGPEARFKRRHSDYRKLEDAAAWARDTAGDLGESAEQVTRRSVQAFMRDPFARKAGWSFGLWSADPGKHLSAARNAGGSVAAKPAAEYDDAGGQPPWQL